MVCPVESTITLLLIQSKEGSIHLAFVPQDLDCQQIEAGLQELEIAPKQVWEIKDWKTTSCNLAVVALPFLRSN